MIAIYVRSDEQIPLMGEDRTINPSISFSDSSYSIPSSVNVFFIEKDTDPQSTITLSLPSGSSFSLVELDQEPTFHTSLTLSPYLSDGFRIYKGIVYVCVDTEPENVIGQLVTDTLTVSIGSSVSTVSLYYYPISTNDKFIELVQNFKQTITETDMRAMYATDVDSTAIDAMVLNAKNKEILLNMMELTGYVGTYRGLAAAIAFYGYTDIITINEIWRNGDIYAYSEAGNGIVSTNYRMRGFTKTGGLQLIYDINEPDGTQDGYGFNNYTNIPINTEDMLLKMYALRNILESRWLPLNSRIVDIVARHRTEAGIKLVDWSIGARSGQTDMNIASQTLGVVIPTTATIKDYSVILSHDYLQDNGTTVSFPAGSPPNGLFGEKYFSVDHIVEDPSTEGTWSTGLYVRRFYRGDFAILTSTITSSTLPIVSYRYTLSKLDNGSWSDVFTSPMQAYGADTINMAVRDYGTFRLTFFFFDGFGSMNIVASDPQTNITISKGSTNFSLVKLSTQTYGTVGRFALDITAVYPFLNPNASVASHVQVSPKDTTFDIHQTIASNTSNIKLYDILNGYDANALSASSGVPDMYCKLSSLTGVNIARMAGVPMAFYGYSYANIMLDVISDGSLGSRSFSVRMFDHKDWETISSVYDNTAQSNKNKFINDMVVQLNALTSGVLSRFTYTVDFFSYNMDVTERKPVIRMVAKEKGFITTKLKIQTVGIEATSKNSTFYAKFDGIANIIYGSSASGDMTIQYTVDAKVPDVRTLTIPSLSFPTKGDLKAYLDNLFLTTDGMDANTFDNLNNSFQIRTRQTLRISHISFGSIVAMPRGESATAYSFTTTGSQYKVSEPVYAIIEDWNAFYKPYNSRMANWNIRWTATNDITGAIETMQYGFVFRKRFFKAGSYTLKLETKDYYGDSVMVKAGSILVV